MKRKRFVPPRLTLFEKVAAVIFSGVLLACLGGIACYFALTGSAQAQFEKLAAAARAAPAAAAASAGGAPSPVLEALRAQNPDTAAWLRAEGTALDYPVMYTPESPQFYLRRDFAGGYSLAGTPFFDEACTPGESANLVVHGHNLHSGGMFAVLEEYRDANYWRAHTTLCLELADGPHLYKIFAVVEAELTPENLGSYYALTGADGPPAPEAHAAYAAFLKEQALYATGVEPAPGAKLLTLSTCTNISPNGRLLVAACEIPPAA